MLKQISRILLCVIILLPCRSLFAQYASTYLYTKADGLPNSEVHYVGFNKKGEMILSFALQGLYKYDGEKFTPFLDSLISDINSLQVDDQQHYWITNYDNLFYVTEEQIFHWTTQPQKQDPVLKDTIYPGEAIEDGIVHVPWRKGKTFFTNLASHTTRRAYEFEPQLKAFILKDSFPDFNALDYAQALIEKNGELSMIDPNWIKEITTFSPFDFSMDQSYSFTRINFVPRDKPRHCLVLRDHQIFEVQLSPSLSQIGAIEEEVNKISYVDQHLLLLFDTGPVKHLYELDEQFRQVRYLKFRSDSEIINITKDPYGTYWGASHEGLWRIFPYFTNFFKEDNDRMLLSIHALVGDLEGKLWFGSYGQGIGYIQNDQVITDLKNIPNDLKILTGALLDQDNQPMFITSSSKKYLNKGIIKVEEGEGLLQISPNRLPGYYLTLNRDGKLLFGTNGKGLLIRQTAGDTTEQNWTRLGPEKGFALGNVLSAVQDKKGRYWMTHYSAGLSVYLPDQDTIYNFLAKEGKYNAKTICTAIDESGQLFFGTDRGLAFFNPPDLISSSDHPEKWLNYLDTTIKAGDQFLLSLQKLNNQFFATSSLNGFHLYTVNNKGAGNPLSNIYTFDPKNGYLGGLGEQNAIWTDPVKQDCWFANDKGISRLNFKDLKITSDQPKLLLDKVGGTYLSGDISQKMKTSKMNKSFYLQYHLQKSLNPIVDDYFLYDLDNQGAIFTRKNEIQLDDLPYGKHLLNITGFRNGVASVTESIQFQIPRPYFMTTGFLVSMFLIGLLSGSAFFFYKENRNRRRREVSNLRIKNLIDGLSPHFLGNSFNWIKNRAKLSKDQEAVQIIIKMDKITRTIFQNSRKNKATQSLREELMLLEDYFDIQKARYGSKHQYQIGDLDPDLAIDDIQIPMMFLQILCENAIEHGLQKKEDGSGNVWVKVIEKEEGLEILVEDDGIGRNRASQMENSGFGQSTKMLKELVQELNKFNASKFIFEYDDDIFIDNNGNKHGTRCKVFIPKKFNYEIPH